MRSKNVTKHVHLSLRFLEPPGMATNTLYHVLRAADPAAGLEPLPADHRVALRDQVTNVAPRVHAPRSRRVLQIALAVIVTLALTTGIAWAAGALSPLALFQSNPRTRPLGARWSLGSARRCGLRERSRI